MFYYTSLKKLRETLELLAEKPLSPLFANLKDIADEHIPIDTAIYIIRNEIQRIERLLNNSYSSNNNEEIPEIIIDINNQTIEAMNIYLNAWRYLALYIEENDKRYCQEALPLAEKAEEMLSKIELNQEELLLNIPIEI